LNLSTVWNSKGSQTKYPKRDARLQLITQETTRGVSHCGGLAIYIKKYLKTKEESPKTQVFHTMQKIYSSKTPLKENQILQHIITL
jgi:hypothetical protein